MTRPRYDARLVARIDLDRLAANWRALDRLSGKARCAGVIKADAYGHGMRAIALTLAHAGCRDFFTASFAEARRLRTILPDADTFTIGVFDSLAGDGGDDARDAVLREAILPSINSCHDLAILAGWARENKNGDDPIPAMLQLDTGMNRLGVDAGEFPRLANSDDFAAADWRLVFSHLACADDPGDPMNAAQKEAFDSMRASRPALKDIPASLAATGGIMLGEDYHYDLTRPGIGLYGAAPVPALKEHIKPVLSLAARVLQIRDAKAGETVGYGAEGKLTKPARLATIGGGYGDGIPRALGNHKCGAHKDGLTAPFIGRVSMDSCVIDITAWPETHLGVGDYVDLLHDGHSAADMAEAAGTIDYDILTRLSLRAEAHYAGAIRSKIDL